MNIDTKCYLINPCVV